MENDLSKERLENDIHLIKNNLTNFGLKLELVYAALSGNEISKDGGLVGEISKQKEELKQLIKRVEDIEEKEGQRQIYVHIIFAAVGALITILVTYFLKR